MASLIPATTLASWLADGDEIALLDVREFGLYGEGHPFFAINLPYSRIELDAPRLLPRPGIRIVVFDDGDALSPRAACRLEELGYTQVWILAGGAPGWREAGYELFKGVNVPSKTFGELVEHAALTPHITPQDLYRRQAAGEPLLLIDGRTIEEHRKQTIPGALPIPNGELVARLDVSRLPPDLPIVVHCAGRTRSIIGAQTLRDLGLPNPVMALENGTQGWQLAGYDLERGSARPVPARSNDTHTYQARAATLAARHRIVALDAAAAQGWLDDDARTTYVLDVRTQEEFAQGTLEGARHAPGGQLIQATDHAVAVKGARILVLDDDGARAQVAASWLRRLGYEAATVERGIAANLAVPVRIKAPVIQAPAELAGQALATQYRDYDVVLDLRHSLAHRRAHPAGALWTTRARLGQQLQGQAQSILLIADDEDIVALAARDLYELGLQAISWTRWSAWQALGLPVQSTPEAPSNAQAIDMLFFVHDRHDGNLESARQYLAWETALIGQCRPEELAHFQLHEAPGARG